MTENKRYILKQGKYGMYFEDRLFNHSLTLNEILELLNRGDKTFQQTDS